MSGFLTSIKALWISVMEVPLRVLVWWHIEQLENMERRDKIIEEWRQRRG